MAELTYDAIHDQVRTARMLDDRTPKGIRLGTSQVETIQKQQAALAGLDDVGPLSEFLGMQILPSRAADRMQLVYEGDADDDAPTTVNVPPPPESVEEQPA